MSSAMDKAMMMMKLEDEDEYVPFSLPDLAEYSSAESNVVLLEESLIRNVKKCRV